MALTTTSTTATAAATTADPAGPTASILGQLLENLNYVDPAPSAEAAAEIEAVLAREVAVIKREYAAGADDDNDDNNNNNDDDDRMTDTPSDQPAQQARLLHPRLRPLPAPAYSAAIEAAHSAIRDAAAATTTTTADGDGVPDGWSLGGIDQGRYTDMPAGPGPVPAVVDGGAGAGAGGETATDPLARLYSTHTYLSARLAHLQLLATTMPAAATSAATAGLAGTTTFGQAGWLVGNEVLAKLVSRVDEEAELVGHGAAAVGAEEANGQSRVASELALLKGEWEGAVGRLAGVLDALDEVGASSVI